MNKQNRRDIEKLIQKLDEVKTDLEYMQEDEQSKLDNMPENLQESERAEQMQTAIDQIEYACDSLQEAIDNLQEIVDQ